MSGHRSSTLLTIAVAVVVLIFAAGLPLIDALLGRTRRVVPAGTQVALIARDNAAIATDAGARTVRFVPASGWEELEADEHRSGVVELTKGGIAFELDAETKRPDGACEQALPPAEITLQELDGSGTLHDAQSFTTDAGEVGVTAPFVGARVEGLVFVVCARGVTVTVLASGSIGGLQGAAADPVVSMTESIEFV